MKLPCSFVNVVSLEAGNVTLLLFSISLFKNAAFSCFVFFPFIFYFWVA